MSIEYYNENVLYAIASSIGKLVNIDVDTILATYACFDRVYVEIDLTKPLVAQFWLNERWHSVVYEGIDLICFSYERYGHKTENCSERNKSKEATTSENSGKGQGQEGPSCGNYGQNDNSKLQPQRGQNRTTNVSLLHNEESST